MSVCVMHGGRIGRVFCVLLLFFLPHIDDVLMLIHTHINTHIHKQRHAGCLLPFIYE